VLLVTATCSALAWIVLLPPLQGPDEGSHFAYSQRIWERHDIPWTPGGAKAGPFSRDVQYALGIAGFGPLAANIQARPLWTRADERLWATYARTASRSNGGYTSAYRNPPLYYLYEVVPYAAASGGTFFDQELLMRLANVPLLLTTLVFVWLLAGELFGRRRPLQFVATAVAASVPQLLNVTATVNPDIALVATWSAALYVIAVLFRTGPRARPLAWLAVLNVIGLLIHPRSAMLLIPSALAVLLTVARERGWRRVTPLRTGIATAVVLGLVSLAWATTGKGSAREFASYVWQFYLPKLGFMNNTIGPITYDVHSAFVGRVFGGLAELEVGLPPTADDLLWWITRLGLVAIVVALVLRRRQVRRHAGLMVVLVVALGSLLLGLHLIAYRAMVGNPNDPIITGRYLLPLVALLGVAVALVGDVLPRSLRSAYSGVVVAGAVALQLMGLGLLLGRFYG
jgi:hypothetical protein